MTKPENYMKQVGVIGAGVMGTGLAQDLARNGVDVVLMDNAPAALEKAENEVGRFARMGRLWGIDTTKFGDMTERVRYTTEMAELGSVDFLIENITEDWELKSSIYPTIDRICPEHVVFAANTSCIPVTRIASITSRPDRVLGMHFMNPVPMKPTVEVIRGYHTSPASLDAATELLTALGKRGVVVNDYPGFVSNRMLMVNEAIFLVQDQVADAAAVDDIFRSCFGHASGPLETADLIGLDTILQSIRGLYEFYGDPKFRPAPLLQKMVDAKLFGRKSGQGFYAYA